LILANTIENVTEGEKREEGDEMARDISYSYFCGKHLPHVLECILPHCPSIKQLNMCQE
jgi:hypothetical protein